VTHGRTWGDATDKFVAKCEAFGYTISLSEKINQALAEAGINAR